MTSSLRTHWRKISTALLLGTLLGVGGFQLKQSLADDCCGPGSPCCYPGSPCCHGHAHAQR